MTQHIHSVTAAVDNGAGGLPERLAFANANRLVPEFGLLGCVLLFEAGGRDAGCENDRPDTARISG